jgi:hypothetical protein
MVTLAIFVDSLQFAHYKQFNDLGLYSIPCRQSFGYSINIKTEIFAGLTPDQLGYLNEWNFNPAGKIRKNFFDMFNGNRFLSRLLRYGYRRFLGRPTGMIPFGQLGLWTYYGTLPYHKTFSKRTVFDLPHTKVYSYPDYTGPHKDIGVFADLKRYITSPSFGTDERIFAIAAQYDHYHHKYPHGSSELEEKTEEILNNIFGCVEALYDRNIESKVMVFSDHGMVPVTGTDDVHLAKEFGPHGKKYRAFFDATMIRVWSDDLVLLQEVESYLRECPGCLCDSAYRKQYGITNKLFGDIIYVAPAGKIIWPNNFSFSLELPSNMHGYLPETDEQLGVFASSFSPCCAEMNPGEVYFMIRRDSDAKRAY